MSDPKPVDYFKLPIEVWTVKDLTDATGIAGAATLLGTSEGAIRMGRHRKYLRLDRIQALQDEVRRDEKAYRSKLVTIRNFARPNA